MPADHIRAGRTIPDKLPSIVMSDGNTSLRGHDYRSQRTAEVFLDLHVWTFDAGQDAAKEIAGAVVAALDKPLTFDGATATIFASPPPAIWRDPDPQFGHACCRLEAFVRWIT